MSKRGEWEGAGSMKSAPCFQRREKAHCYNEYQKFKIALQVHLDGL